MLRTVKQRQIWTEYVMIVVHRPDTSNTLGMILCSLDFFLYEDMKYFYYEGVIYQIEPQIRWG